jgi:hypothetical protein
MYGYGYESSANLTAGKLHYKLQTVLSSKVPQDEEQSNFPVKEKKKKNLVMAPQRGAQLQDILTD